LTSSIAKARLARLKADFPLYARTCLRVLPKDGGQPAPFRTNRAQIFLHACLEDQLKQIGKVRALVLKGRQQGISTYVGARFYHKASLNRGIRVFILTHQQDATDQLFGMVERFHANAPFKPVTGAANAKELLFPRLDSGYTVATAGSADVGRSKTIRLFHGSEVALWKHAPTHFAGAVQAVPNTPGTEIILESTAKGMGNEFHQRWQQAEAGEGAYQPIFIPWFWQEEYRLPVPDGFQFTDEELDFAELYDLDDQQIVWRREKLAEMKDPLLFMQEYPSNAAEAFQTTGLDSFIKPHQVLKARKTSLTGRGPLVCGADPARFGDDRFSVAFRQGRKLLNVESKQGLDVVAGANWLKSIIDQHKPKKMFIDVGGLGVGVLDILISWGPPYSTIVEGVNFGDPAQEAELRPAGGGPRNRRAEMWERSRDWLDDVGGADIPDLDSLQRDACGPGYSYDMNSRLLLEPKEKMRSRGVRSPDEWDAVALTFASPVADIQGGGRLEMPEQSYV
jgi:hypothetical protein